MKKSDAKTSIELSVERRRKQSGSFPLLKTLSNKRDAKTEKERSLAPPKARDGSGLALLSRTSVVDDDQGGEARIQAILCDHICLMKETLKNAKKPVKRGLYAVRDPFEMISMSGDFLQPGQSSSSVTPSCVSPVPDSSWVSFACPRDFASAAIPRQPCPLLGRRVRGGGSAMRWP